MDSNDPAPPEPGITLADIRAALAAERDKSKIELIAELHIQTDRAASDRDKWKCKMGRHIAIEDGLRLIRDLEAAANRPALDERQGGAA